MHVETMGPWRLDLAAADATPVFAVLLLLLAPARGGFLGERFLSIRLERQALVVRLSLGRELLSHPGVFVMNRALAFAVSLLFLSPCVATADYGVRDEGSWPATWPKELDGLRAQSRTLEGPRVLLLHYAIPFAKREEFETSWPHLLKVKSPGAPIVLTRGTNFWLGDKSKAGVCIHTPPGGEAPLDGKSAKGSWEKTVYIELIVDGDVVDLNRIALPPDTPIIDKRFEEKLIGQQRGSRRRAWPNRPIAYRCPGRLQSHFCSRGRCHLCTQLNEPGRLPMGGGRRPGWRQNDRVRGCATIGIIRSLTISWTLSSLTASPFFIEGDLYVDGTWQWTAVSRWHYAPGNIEGWGTVGAGRFEFDTIVCCRRAAGSGTGKGEERHCPLPAGRGTIARHV